MSKRKAEVLLHEGSVLEDEQLVTGITADPEGLPNHNPEVLPIGTEERISDVATYEHAERAEVASGGNPTWVVTTQSPSNEADVAGTIANREVVPSPRFLQEDDVAVEEGVEPHPFWDLLRQARYELRLRNFC